MGRMKNKKILLPIIVGSVVLLAGLVVGAVFGLERMHRHDFTKTGQTTISALEVSLDEETLVRSSSVIVKGAFTEVINSFSDSEEEDAETSGDEFYVLKFKVSETYMGESETKDGYIQFVYPTKEAPAGLDWDEECIVCLEYFGEQVNDKPVYGFVSYSDGIFYRDGMFGFENIRGKKFSDIKEYL